MVTVLWLQREISRKIFIRYYRREMYVFKWNFCFVLQTGAWDIGRNGNAKADRDNNILWVDFLTYYFPCLREIQGGERRLLQGCDKSTYLFLSLNMCALYMEHGCLHMQMSEWTSCSSVLCIIVLRWGLSLNCKTSVKLGWLVSELGIHLSLPSNAEIIDMCSHVWLFTWISQMQIQVFLFEEQVALSTEPSLQPISF